ncbi:helix-turn-helix transcriptional regulator [Kribbella yunnanensis]|uniref:Helix-turn-helix transcriptional regulator n=1 Tax=Kribbella yunnanensis TaxID=190194 RepID=A0ABP4UZ36_9ACTN
MAPSTELAAFLKAQRARLRPEDVGLVSDTVPRRVPGLRREEVARLAGVSTDYYTRLEQGRKASPSDSVINAVARALLMDKAGRQHLYDLCRPVLERPTHAPSVQRVRRPAQLLLDSLADQPALVVGRGTEVLAINALGRALLADFEAMPAIQRNYTRWMLLDPQARILFRDWPVRAAEMVASLRMEAGRHPDDQGISNLVGELMVNSREFSAWWADQRVIVHNHGIKSLHHPLVGDLDLHWQNLIMAGDDQQNLVVYFAEPESSAAESLKLLASWSASTAGAERPLMATESATPQEQRRPDRGTPGARVRKQAQRLRPPPHA